VGSTLTVNGAVSGGGQVIISGGTANFNQAFTQSVTFSGTGTLTLAQSQSYKGAVTGLSTTGANALDLRDITFGKSTTAKYSGTSVSGTLTVTDGTHTSNIALNGNFVGATFICSSDGHGGTTVIDPTVAISPASATPTAFATAMAGLGPTFAAGPTVMQTDLSSRAATTLARPGSG
jgi:autotransporter-associated beta strand protein